jgi:hypothetical protein
MVATPTTCRAQLLRNEYLRSTFQGNLERREKKKNSAFILSEKFGFERINAERISTPSVRIKRV